MDDLTKCLAACNDLTYHKICLECDLFEEFRKTAFQLIINANLEMSPQGGTIQRHLWNLVRRTSESPLKWEGSLSGAIGFQDTDFATVVANNLGRYEIDLARKLETLWNSMVKSTGLGSPVESVLREQIEICRNSVNDFKILTSSLYKPDYLALLSGLELEGAEVFCTASNLKSHQPFSILLTCGPFREDDLLFTAPRYRKIVNVRWSTDHDIQGFPYYLTQTTGNTPETMFPPDFPCRVSEQIEKRTFSLQFLPELITTGDWSYNQFEEVFIKRRRRYRGYLGNRMEATSGPQPGSGGTGSPSEFSPAYVKLVFYDGSAEIYEFDQQRKPPLFFSIDRESDFEIKKRRPFDATWQTAEEEGEEALKPGMLVVKEPKASESLIDSAFERAEVETQHLKRWKTKLQEKLASLRQAGGNLNVEMQNLGIAENYINVENAVKRWSRYEPGQITAPKDRLTFKLILDFVQYPAVEEAWHEIVDLRGASISQGLITQSNIDQYLKRSVENRIGEVLDSPKTILDVDGFKGKVEIIEVAETYYLSENDRSENGLFDSPVTRLPETDDPATRN